MNPIIYNTNAILYARLSREDSENEVSSSIKNQIDLLTNYAIKHNFKVIDICSDDGYSGGNFERPGFKQMMEQLENGIANVVIVKDLSRFGRDFIKVSSYIDEYFIDNNIRFISINDNYDSAISEEDISIVFKSFLNGLYLKEFKKKMKLGIDNKAKKVTLKYTGCYGYVNVDGKLEIDYEGAPIVVRIFKEYLSGKKPTEICKKLNNEGIPSPSLYRYQKQEINHYLMNNSVWNREAIYRIIKRIDYTGDTLNQKYIYTNDKKKINNKPIIIKNTHESIIDIETFKKVQKMIYQKKRTPQEILDRLLCDILTTTDDRKVCYGYWKHRLDKSKKYEYYECKPVNILIRVDYVHKVLYEYSLSLIKSILKEKDKFKKEMVKLLVENNNFDKKLKQIDSELADIDYQFSNLFEMYALEEISVEDYDAKRKELTENQVLLIKEKSKLKKSNITVNEINKSLDKFINSVNDNTLKMSDIELIRFCIKKVIISKVDNQYELKIIDVFK